MEAKEYLRVFESVRYGEKGTKAKPEGDLYEGMCASEVSDYLLGLDEEDYDDEEWEEQYDLDLDAELLASIQNLRKSFQLMEQRDENYPKEEYWKKRSVETLFRGISSIESTEIVEGKSLRESIELYINGKEEWNSEDEDELEICEKKEKILPPQNQCFICLEEFEPDADIVKLQSCSHRYCRECLNNYICFKSNDAACLYHHIHLIYKEKKMVVRIDEMNAYGIPCPALQCKHVMLINELVPVATTSAIDRFLRFSEIHKQSLIDLENMPNEEEIDPVCPKCQQERKVKRIRNDRLRCLTCWTPFCRRCLGAHPNYQPCGYQRAEKVRYSFSHHRATRCPHCKAPIEKDGGCNFMVSYFHSFLN
eukprot:TRINITY_DN8694_c1_g1_i1.p1 TRINITY_DN8694_c1_g1~~TRINITY_DN8694_c1_g1_i1.p1  ORF type:complete len:365 (-),score=97.13 TRINITY_DN8694_c1_g1_i1:48-1142(-)